MINVFMWLKVALSLSLNKNEYFSKVSLFFLNGSQTKWMVSKKLRIRNFFTVPQPYGQMLIMKTYGLAIPLSS